MMLRGVIVGGRRAHEDRLQFVPVVVKEKPKFGARRSGYDAYYYSGLSYDSRVRVFVVVAADYVVGRRRGQQTILWLPQRSS
jgi:hypothetical protein